MRRLTVRQSTLRWEGFRSILNMKPFLQESRVDAAGGR